MSENTSAPTPSARRGLLSFDEGAERLGVTIEELRSRLASAHLVKVTKPGEPTDTKIPEYALQAAGFSAADATRTDRRLRRLLAFVAQREGDSFTTAQAVHASSLTEQEVKIALATLLALDLVRKTSEPPPNGRGGLQTIWRAVRQS